jgi:regulatory protein
LKRPRTLKARALQLLAQREQSRVELRRKLLAHVRTTEATTARAIAADASIGPDHDAPAEADSDADARHEAAQAEVESVLAWLEANGFLSAERFVESRVNARAARFGNLRIRHELARHELVLGAEAQQALVDSELGRARAVHARKFGGAPSSAAERARQARFLGARGFSADVIRRVLREAGRAGTGDA